MGGSESSRLLLVAQPSPAGAAFLAQSLLDAQRAGLQLLWLCHPDWSEPGPFWGRTLKVLRENPGGLPLRRGPGAAPARFPGSWNASGFTLVLLGIPYPRSRGGGLEGARQVQRRCREELAALVAPRRRVVHVHRHAGDWVAGAGRDRVAHVFVSQQGCCHLDFTTRAPLARLGAVANLAREERRCRDRWLRRARGLIARFQRGNWDVRLSQVLPRLCQHDWAFLEEAELPDLALPRASMVVLQDTVLLDLSGIPTGFRLHAMEEAMGVTGRGYCVGLLNRRDGTGLLVARRWRRGTGLPPVGRRLARVAGRPGWLRPAADHFYSPILEEESLQGLLDEVVTGLEGAGGPLPRGGEAVLHWKGCEIRFGKPGGETVTVATSEQSGSSSAFSSSDEDGLSWRVRGDLGRPRHPLRRLLAGRLRPVPDHFRLRDILAAYRRILFPPGEKGRVHRLRGRLATGIGSLGGSEDERVVRERIQRFLEETHWPWPAALLGGGAETAERGRLHALGRGEGDSETLLWLLETLGDRPDEVGTLPEAALELDVASVLDPRPAPGVLWPATHLELVELVLHNAAEHGGSAILPPLLVVFGSAQGPEVRIRDYGAGLDSPLAAVLERSRERQGGGLFHVHEELERVHGVAWFRDSREGYASNGRESSALRRRWILVGEVRVPGSYPEWLDLVRVSGPEAAARLAESHEPGAFDGMVLGSKVSSSEFRVLASSQQAWRWLNLPRVRLGAPGPGELALDSATWLDSLARMPGMEVGWRLSPLR